MRMPTFRRLRGGYSSSQYESLSPDGQAIRLLVPMVASDALVKEGLDISDRSLRKS
jgi:4-aminobutyrate aminotransferase-like enzyme